MGIKQKLTGTGMDIMPDFAFKGMSFIFSIWEIFASPGKMLEKFGIRPGDTIIDYGCGPGSYIRAASSLAGREGIVYAADIHKLAIASVKKKISRYQLTNVRTVLIVDGKCDIPENTADVIYALDMFHMVNQPEAFLKELHRLVKKNGRLIIEDGHQPREQSRQKINDSKLWNIKGETKGWLVCTPV